MPSAASTQDIGSDDVPWRWVYAQYFQGDGNNITNINIDNVEGTLPVGKGGTGATSFTANSVIMSGSTTTGAFTTRGIKNMTAAGNLGWTSNTADNTLVTNNTLAYWNGRYNASASNLAYCNKGAFGTIITKNVDDYILRSTIDAPYDMIYAGSDEVPIRLAPNTTTTKKFLRMTGTGSAGTAPVWDTIAAGDIPSLAASKITSGTFDAARIPNLNWSKITAGKPTTLAGYGILDAEIAEGAITLGSNTITPVTSVNGHTGNSVTVTVADLGLSNAMHFIGKATVAITDGSTTNPTISGYDFANKKAAGDVIIDKDTSYEYVWTTENKWERLGGDSSYKVVQTAVTKPSAATNKWVSAIGQDTNGNITVDYGTLDTSGTWSGTATKATGDDSGNNIVNTYLTKSTYNTGAKGDIIYWSAANTPAHLTNTSSTTKHFLSITSQVPAWTTLSKGDVGLGNVENTALSTWAGSNKITTIGTLSSGTVPLARVSDADDLKKIEALTGTSGFLKKTAANTWSLDTTTYLTTVTKTGDIAVSVSGSTVAVDSTPIEIEIIRL